MENKLNESINNLNNKTIEIIEQIESINLEQNNSNNKINILYNENNDIKIEINQIKGNYTLFKNNIGDIEKKLEQLENQLNESKNELIDLREENENLKYRLNCIESEKYNKNIHYYNLFQGTTILDNNDKKIISKWIKPYYNLKFQLLYKASGNDISNNEFHSKCDYKGPTVFIITTDNNKKIGGFASSSWHKENNYIVDDNSFLFSLDYRIKYGLKEKGKDALFGQGGSSILFGPNADNRDDFVIVNNILYCNRESSYHFYFEREELCGGYRATIIDFEIYSVKNYNP